MQDKLNIGALAGFSCNQKAKAEKGSSWRVHFCYSRTLKFYLCWETSRKPTYSLELWGSVFPAGCIPNHTDGCYLHQPWQPKRFKVQCSTESTAIAYRKVGGMDLCSKFISTQSNCIFQTREDIKCKPQSLRVFFSPSASLLDHDHKGRHTPMTKSGVSHILWLFYLVLSGANFKKLDLSVSKPPYYCLETELVGSSIYCVITNRESRALKPTRAICPYHNFLLLGLLFLS